MANNITPLVNGIRHSWASVRVNVLGRTVTGITEINYEDDQEMEDAIGAGGLPTHRGLGKYTAKADMKLYNYEVDAILQAAGKGASLQDIAPFDITITYLEDGNDGLVTHVLRNVQFTGNKRSAKGGDKNLTVPMKLIISHIEWNN
jgi:hypothetical protein